MTSRPALRNIGGSLAVLAGVLALSLGLPAIDRALPVQNPVDPDRRLPVGGGVTVLPPPDSFLDASGTDPSGGRVKLVVNGLDYLLQETPFAGTLPELASRARDEVTRRDGVQSVGDQRNTATAQGIAGIRAGYSTVDGFGWYEVYLHGGRGVTILVEGNDRSIAANADAVDASIATLEFPGLL